MINLELSPGHQNISKMINGMAKSMIRPLARKYDTKEHEKAVELESLAKMIDQMGGSLGGGGKKDKEESGVPQIKNGSQMMGVIGAMEMCWACTGLTLAIPGMGLGNAAIDAVASDEQKERFGKVFAAMAITEPGTGSDSANICTTAALDGDEWVINGEKIFVTDGGQCTHIVVWATLDKSVGKAAIKSFVVPKDAPGLEVVRLEKKMGIRASDTAAITFTNCRIPKDNILGDPTIAKTAEERKKAFGGVMQTFDNTRPAVGAMASGVARAALDMTREILEKEGVSLDYGKRRWNSSALQAEFYSMEADYEAARLLILKAAWLADNKIPNSKEASMCKAKSGRVGSYITLRCVEICSSLGYGEEYLLEKFARDSKILDIFEGTQQIQQLIVARHQLGLSSRELK
ncbi:MAG: acyl-CoA dehydrogenase family protein [Pseudomonadales bacterium]|nr:acyl-CoA dehydrogenase family protein [Pseudomonadales bacterium]